MRAGRRLIVGLLGFVVIVVGGILGWRWLQPATPRIDAGDAAQVAQGQAVYESQCSRCHGADLEGQPNWRERQANGRLPAPPHDATGHTWHHPDSVLFNLTRHGIGEYAPPGYESDMPAFDATLTDGQIAAVLAYIKSRWPPHILAQQARINSQANQQ